MKKHTLPRHVRRKTAKGREYFYYDTGKLNAKGKPILTPLPHVSDRSFGEKLAAANRLRSRRVADTGVLTVAKLVDLFQKSQQFKAKANGTQTSYNHFLQHIVDEMGEAPANDVRRSDAMLLMDKRADKPASANQIVRVLGALYAWGRDREHVTIKPTEEIELNKLGEHRPWPEWLLEEALASADETVSLTTHLLYFTAQRIGDVLKMRWTDIRGGRLSVKQEKTGTPLEITLHERLSTKLASLPRIGFTIISKEDGTPYSPFTVRRMLQAFAEGRGQKVVPHGLRKNAVNALLEAGCSTYEVQAISGQSPGIIEHYAKHRDKTRLGDAAILRWQNR